MSDVACPICVDGILERGEGRLDQSGDSYLPTIALRCPRCEYARYQPAVGAKWVSAVPSPTRAGSAPRIAPTRLDAPAEPLAA